MNIRSIGFRDIRECVALWRLILWSLACNKHEELSYVLILVKMIWKPWCSCTYVKENWFTFFFNIAQVFYDIA